MKEQFTTLSMFTEGISGREGLTFNCSFVLGPPDYFISKQSKKTWEVTSYAKSTAPSLVEQLITFTFGDRTKYFIQNVVWKIH